MNSSRGITQEQNFRERMYTRRQFVEYQKIIAGEPAKVPADSDMDQLMTWAEWGQQK